MTPTLGMLKTSRDVGGAEWFGRMPGLIRQFLKGTDSAVLILNDESLSLNRTVADEAAREELLKAARAALPPTLIIDASKLRIAPGLHLVRLGEGWEISGAVPDEATAGFVRQMVEEADPASVGKNVSTKLMVRPGMPAGPWLRRMKPFFQQYAVGVRSGAEITVTGKEVILDGDVTDNAVASRLQTTADATFGAPMQVVSRLVNAGNPLRKMVIDFGKAPGAEVVVTAAVPAAQTSDQFQKGLQEAFPSRRLSLSGLRVEPLSQPEDWFDNLPRFLLEFGRRSQGTGLLKLEVRKAILAGVVPNEISRDALGLYATWALGPTFAVENELVVDAKAVAQAPYEVSRIPFEEGKAAMDAKHLPILTGVAARMKQPGGRVALVKAFASKSGSEPANLAISAKRVDVVRAELVKQGVEEERLLVQATGKGGSAGRGGERRVELVLLEE
jgi:outer membrane protein OmpA-like peptidoglycan-associated protein